MHYIYVLANIKKMMKSTILVMMLIGITSCNLSENNKDEENNQSITTISSPIIDLRIFNPYPEFHINGEVSSVDTYFNQDPIYRSERFEFDNYGNIIKYYINYDSITKIASLKEVFQYDSLNRVTFSKRMQVNGITNDSMIEIGSYQYDDINQEIYWSYMKDSVTNFYKTSVSTENEHITFKTLDTLEQLNSTHHYDFSGNQLFYEKESYSIDYSYDDLNRLVNKTTMKNNLQELSTLNSYEDDNIFPMLTISQLYDNAPDSIKYEYQLDKNNNWVECRGDSEPSPFGGENLSVRVVKYK
jgi:hypothetical protein